MLIAYSLFLLFIIFLLALDLGLFHRESHEVGIEEALFWTGVWVMGALLFNLFIYFLYEYQWLSNPEFQKSGGIAALQFFLGRTRN